MSSTTTNPTATFTNNLGFDVDIYDVFNPDTSKQGPLTYTFVVTVPNGASAQKVQTIRRYSQLQAMRTGNIEALNNNYYQQFPVALFVVTPFVSSTAFTLTNSMQQSMEESFKFIKFSQANPTSQLATDFRTALGDKTSQENAVNKFFQGTGSFKLCTMSTWTAVFGWQTQFTNPWQGTYYLYSLGSSSPGSSSAPALVATLVITSSADANSAVLTMANTNDENTTVVMAGNGSMQEQDPGLGNVSVALAPAWLNVSQTSQQNGKTVYNYVIGAAFTGTINGINVAGNLNQLAIPDPSDSSQNAKDKNSANTWSISAIASLVGILTGTLGVVTSIGMVYFMWKGSKQAEDQKKLDAQKDAKNKADANAKELKVEQDYQKDEVPKVKAEAAKVEAEVLPKVQEAYKEVDQAEKIQRGENNLEEQEQRIDDALENGAANDEIEEAGDKLEDARGKFEDAVNPNANANDRDADLANAQGDLNDASGKIQAVLQDEAGQLPEEVEKSLSNAKDAMQKQEQENEAADQAEERQQEQDKENADEDVNNDNFDNPEEQDAEPFEGGGVEVGGK